MKVKLIIITGILFMISCSSNSAYKISPHGSLKEDHPVDTNENSESNKKYIIYGDPIFHSLYDGKSSGKVVNLSEFCSPMRTLKIKVYRPTYSAILAWLTAGFLFGQTNMEISCGNIDFK